MTRVFSMGWNWNLKFAVISFCDHLLPRNAFLILSTSFLRSDLNRFRHLYLFRYNVLFLCNVSRCTRAARTPSPSTQKGKQCETQRRTGAFYKHAPEAEQKFWRFLKFLCTYIFFAAQQRKDSSRYLGIWHPIHTVHSSTRIFQSHAKTKCGNPPTEGLFLRTGILFAFYVRWSWSSKDFSDAQLTLRRKFSDICFHTHMSVSFEFVRGAVGFFEILDTLIRVRLSSPVWSFDRVPKFYQLTMQCVNAQLHEKQQQQKMICWRETIRSSISKAIL